VRVLGCALIDRRAIVRLTIGTATIAAAIMLLVVANVWLAVAITSMPAAFAIERLGRPLPELRGRMGTPTVPLPHPIVARAWLQLSCTWHRDRVHLMLSIAIQTSAIELGALAAAHVTDAPDELHWVVLLASCCASAMALWTAVRSERALADDRWLLDPLIGARAIDLGGRMIAAAVLTLPLLVVTIAMLGRHPVPVLAFGCALAGVAWCSAVAVELVTRAEVRRTLRQPQMWALVLRIAIGIAAALAFGVPGLLVHAMLAAWVAARRWELADLTRRRFARLPGEIEAAVS